jgi:hypothetical protein
MNLMIEVNLTVVQVESDEAKGAVLPATVCADVFALHEAHVGLEEQVHFLAGVRVPADAGAEDPHIADVAVEIGDLRRLVRYSTRVSMSCKQATGPVS